MRLRAKILLFLLVSSSIIFMLVIGFIVFKYRNNSLKEARRLVNSFAQQSANSVKSTLEKDLEVTKTMAYTFLGYKKIPKKIRHEVYTDMLGNILKGHPEYLAVWMSWELRFIDNNYNKKYGRQRTVSLINAGQIKYITDTVETEGDNLGSTYYNAKMSLKEVLTNPYFYVYSPSEGGDSILETSVSSPIIIDGEFAGLAGIDITLDRFQKITDQIKPYKNSYSFLLANNGSIISFPESKNQGRNVNDIFPEFSKFDVLKYVREGKNYSFVFQDSSGYSNYVAFAPIEIGNSESSWSVCLVAPTRNINKEAINNFNNSLFIGFIGLVLFGLIVFIIAQRLTLPLKKSISILQDLDKGIIDFSKQISARSKDELAEMARSINNLMKTLNNTANFAKKIGQGDFTAFYNPLSDHDVLGNALIEMQKNLRIAKEQEEIRGLDQKKIDWQQEGISQLSEVLQKSSDSLEEYLFKIISNIINYLKAEQGAIFLLNEEDPDAQFLELKTAFAYDRKKILETRFEIGESLVGRCFQEKEIIHLNKLPEGYSFISSGLGEHEPQSLILLPLMFESDVFGVIEIASLHDFADYEIEFIKNAGERITSSISIMTKNIKTKDLLEKYQSQSDEISRSEKEMAENIIELENAQEEAIIKQKETEGLIDALSKMASVVWYDLNGKILNIIDPNLEDAGLTEKEMIGRFQSSFAPEAKDSPEEYKKFWDALRAGYKRKRLFKTETQKGTLWISEIYTPIKDAEGKPYKIINIGFNISEQKVLEQEIEKLQKEIADLKDKSNQ